MLFVEGLGEEEPLLREILEGVSGSEIERINAKLALLVSENALPLTPRGSAGRIRAALVDARINCGLPTDVDRRRMDKLTQELYRLLTRTGQG